MRKLLERLKHKYGPLPLWAWALIVGGALALVWRLRAGREQPAEAIAEPAYAFGAEPDYGDTGAVGPVGEVGPVAGEPAEPFRGVSRTELEEAIAEALGNIPGVGPGGEDVVPPDGTEPPPATEPTQGVRWGGQIFTTKSGLAAYLRGRGQSWKQWAKRHPGAAAKLLGPAPKPRPKPKPQPPTKPSGRTGGRAPAKRGRGRAGARARSFGRAAGRVVRAARPRVAPPNPPMILPKRRRRRRRLPARLRAFGRGGKRT